MKRICVWGTSIRKVADEAQILATCQAIWARVPDAEITIFAQHGELIRKRHPGVRTIRTGDIPKVLPSLARSDLFLIVGGPFMESLLQAGSCLALYSMARTVRCPVITYGTTVLGYKTRWGRFLYRNLFNQMDAVTVREEPGLGILHELGVKRPVALVADPRFILNPAPMAETRSILIKEGIDIEMPCIGITTRYLHESVPEWVKRTHGYSASHVSQANEAIGQALNHLGGLAQLLLIPMHPSYEDDLRMADVIRTYMRDPSQLKVLSRQYRSPELIGIIGACDMLIASRLGSAIFATITGTPMLSIAYESRMLAHMETIGCGQYVRDWKDLDPREFLELAKDAWMRRHTMKHKIGLTFQRLRAQTWDDTQLISNFC